MYCDNISTMWQIITPHVCRHRFLPPTANLPSAPLESPPAQTSDELTGNKGQSVFIYPLLSRSFLYMAASAFVLPLSICQPESHQQSKKLTELYV